MKKFLNKLFFLAWGLIFAVYLMLEGISDTKPKKTPDTLLDLELDDLEPNKGG